MEGQPLQKTEKKEQGHTSGLAVGAAIGLAALGGKVILDSHQETREDAPDTTIQMSLEQLSKQDLIKEITQDEQRVVQLERIMADRESAMHNPQNLLVEDFLRPFQEAGTVPDHQAIQTEIERLKARMGEFRARRAVLDALEARP